MLSGYLSIWEVAHRWQNTDPNKTDPENLPFAIQDAIRFLCRLLLQKKLSLYDEVFITPDDGKGKRETFFIDQKTLPSEFELAITDRKYIKKILDGYLIDRFQLFDCSLNDQWDFPDFWFDDELIRVFGGVINNADSSKITKELKLDSARSFIDKNACQAVAKALWDIYPNINISQMTKHPSVLNHGGGKNYKGKHTLRDWLYEIVPEHLKNRRGRPRTKPSNDAA
jgi:hypothetical protein